MRLQELAKSESTLLIATIEAAGVLFNLSLTTDGAGLTSTGTAVQPEHRPRPQRLGRNWTSG